MRFKADNPILPFASAKAWERWLHKNHTSADGVWLRIYKKASGQATVTYAEAVDEALCHGWIDGQKQKCDDDSWLQRFTPRRVKSNWSKVNTGHVERLIAEGRMEPAGLAAIEAAKKDGRWERAYHSQRTAAVPEEFLKRLAKNKRALAFYKTLNKSNLYAIIYRLTTAKKPETLERRMAAILNMLEEGKKFHSVTSSSPT